MNCLLYLWSVEDSWQICVDDRLPLVGLHAHNQSVSGDASIVDQHVHCTPVRHWLLDQPGSTWPLSAWCMATSLCYPGKLSLWSICQQISSISLACEYVYVLSGCNTYSSIDLSTHELPQIDVWLQLVLSECTTESLIGLATDSLSAGGVATHLCDQKGDEWQEFMIAATPAMDALHFIWVMKRCVSHGSKLTFLCILSVCKLSGTIQAHMHSYVHIAVAVSHSRPGKQLTAVPCKCCSVPAAEPLSSTSSAGARGCNFANKHTALLSAHV